MINNTKRFILLQVFLFSLFPIQSMGQSEYAIKQRIQESLDGFMNMLSYVNDEEEVITPSMIATRYSGGNYFRFNGKEMKLQNFIEDYCYSDLKRQVVNHRLSISPNNITKVSNNPSDRRWTVNGVLKRGYATNNRDNISDESIKFIILWRGINEEISLLEIDFYSVPRLSISNVSRQIQANQVDVSRTNTQSDYSEYNNKAYNIGDDAKDFLGEEGYRIAYLDASGKHGFAITDNPRKADYFSDKDLPTMDECRIMFKNRFSLGLTGEYRTSELEKFWEPWDYHSFDFSTGKKHKRKYKDKSVKRMSVRRF